MKVSILLAGLETATAMDKLCQLERFLQKLGENVTTQVLHWGCEEQLPLIRSWAAARPAASPEEQTELTLICSTQPGKRFGMAQAAANGQECYTDVFDLCCEDETVKVCRKVYSTHLTAMLPARDALIVLADTAEKAAELPAGENPAEIGQWQIPHIPGTVLETIPLQIPKDLSREKLVLLGGKGLGSKENFQRLEALAEKLGAACACTRPVALSGWTDFDKVTGVSGWQLNAKVCIAFGVSGAAPLLYGLEGVERIIAVNNDKTAPIFCYAQDGVLADCMEIIEEMEALL